MEQLIKNITWYRDKKQWHPADIESLVNVARSTATEIFFFAVEVGEMHEEMKAAEYRRKSQFAAYSQKLSNDAKEKSDKMTQSEIERNATVYLDEYFKQEAATESAYKKAVLVLQTAQGVHDQMRQHVSHLKEEKRQESNNTGSQHT